MNGVSLVFGSATDQQVDALVVPHFYGEASVGGVGGAVYQAGGQAGLEAFAEQIRTEPLPFGSAVLTRSGCERWPFLINVVTVAVHPDLAPRVVYGAVRESLALAANHGIKSVAIPALGTGIIGSLTAAQSATAIFTASRDSSEQLEHCPEVTVVVYLDEQAYEIFAAVKNNVPEDPPQFGERGRRKFEPARWAIEMIRDHILKIGMR